MQVVHCGEQEIEKALANQNPRFAHDDHSQSRQKLGIDGDLHPATPNNTSMRSGINILPDCCLSLPVKDVADSP